METALRTQSQGFGKSPSDPFRVLLIDAIRFWEPRRLVYNLVLAVVVVLWLVTSWPHFRPVLNLSSLPLLAILALLANACYCAAYLLDIPMQSRSVGNSLRRQRWGLWVIGTLFAILLANYWIGDEIYPFVR
jgi:cytochrome bd-type quinol oxidase subunit 2